MQMVPNSAKHHIRVSESSFTKRLSMQLLSCVLLEEVVGIKLGPSQVVCETSSFLKSYY